MHAYLCTVVYLWEVRMILGKKLRGKMTKEKYVRNWCSLPRVDTTFHTEATFFQGSNSVSRRVQELATSTG
ncbi:hypothetical protein PanWU01x14_125060 [Parasponia andersonii]|uniref:Uncharacterized protein n=1 Tax=Parasponia andersonii TaxID=3476 RepID=A0A2P5CTS1_PARAD|nr:hypothetical protein PanWU01x14_125060 [Parasponia andersonii]